MPTECSAECFDFGIVEEFTSMRRPAGLLAARLAAASTQFVSSAKQTNAFPPSHHSTLTRLATCGANREHRRTSVADIAVEGAQWELMGRSCA
jgi:hypothetical protein